MKKISLMGMMILFILSMQSCKKRFEDLLINPNQPVSVPPYLVMGKELNDIVNNIGGNAPWDAVMRYNQYYCRNYQYYGDNAYSFQEHLEITLMTLRTFSKWKLKQPMQVHLHVMLMLLLVSF